jgi:hypothetical protein
VGQDGGAWARSRTRVAGCGDEQGKTSCDGGVPEMVVEVGVEEKCMGGGI